MAEAIYTDDKKRYILQHKMSLEFVARTKAGKKAEYTFVTGAIDATRFNAIEANEIIAATATDNGKDTEKEFLLMETLIAIEV